MKRATLAAGVAAAFGTILGAGAASAQAPATVTPATVTPPIVARAEQYLARNVDRVVAADPSLESAADFLMNYACAAEVSGAAKYERNIQALRMIDGIFRDIGRATARAPGQPGAPGQPAMPALTIDARVDRETGELVFPDPKPGATPNPFAMMAPTMSAMTDLWPETKPVDLRKLTGDLVLAARERWLSKAR